MSGEERQRGTLESQPSAVPGDPELLARNLARAVEEGGRALAAYLRPREDGEAPAEAIAEQTIEVARTVGAIGAYWTAEPNRLIEAQTRLWGHYLAIWNSALRRAAGEPAEEAVAPAPGDRRFADPEWSQNPMLAALKQLYLATSRWAAELVEATEGVDEHTRHKARFYVQQISNALAPTNFAVTNPEVIRETAESHAENLVKGMHMLAEDLEAGHGTLRVRQSDNQRFKVGDNLATTPGKVIFQNDICQVIQYAPMTQTVLKRPLLIVPPWINKFYILDLTPQKSLIRWAIEQGHTVFVISWVNPDVRHAEKSFEHYMKEGILAALDVIGKATGERRVNAVGYCVGGTLLAVTLAFMAASGDERIAGATLMAAQVDFTHAGDLKVFVDEEQVARLERQMKAAGYLDGTKMATAFNLLRSNDLIWPYVINNYLLGREPFPFDLLYWNADSTRMPAANHSFYLRHFYLQNDLSQGRLEIGGQRLDLKTVTVPVYNLATREDHIAPAKSVFLGSSFFGGPVRFVLAGSGHIAGVVNPPARNKYQHWVGGDARGELEDWLGRAEERPGSWWPDWQGWIETLDDARVKARKPGGRRLKALEDAPGSYVKMRA